MGVGNKVRKQESTFRKDTLHILKGYKQLTKENRKISLQMSEQILDELGIFTRDRVARKRFFNSYKYRFNCYKY